MFLEVFPYINLDWARRVLDSLTLEQPLLHPRQTIRFRFSIEHKTWMKEEQIGGWLFGSDGLKRGYIRLVDDQVDEVCEGSAPSSSTKALVIQSFANAHVHLGDSVAYPAPRGTVQEIVGPPDGHKHKVLRATATEDKVAAMRAASEFMTSTGTALFGDFREEGLAGVRALRTALEGGSISAKIFGRPASADPEDSEIDLLLRESDGIGMSSLNDCPYDLLERLSGKAKSSKRMFSLHASEIAREDIDKILDLKPDYLVHMCKATDDDIESCVSAQVPVVVCPSSNEFFGLKPSLPKLLKAGATVAIGTDNGMITRPDMIEEMKASYRISRSQAGVSPSDIVRLATFNGRKVLNADPKITTEINAQSDLVAIRTHGDDPLLELITKSRSDDVLGTSKGGAFRRTSAWRR
jgi:cytosine/adenosine deaminase-related metal-dependent hydrolase